MAWWRGRFEKAKVSDFLIPSLRLWIISSSNYEDTSIWSLYFEFGTSRSMFLLGRSIKEKCCWSHQAPSSALLISKKKHIRQFAFGRDNKILNDAQRQASQQHKQLCSFGFWSNAKLRAFLTKAPHVDLRCTQRGATQLRDVLGLVREVYCLLFRISRALQFPCLIVTSAPKVIRGEVQCDERSPA